MTGPLAVADSQAVTALADGSLRSITARMHEYLRFSGQIAAEPLGRHLTVGADTATIENAVVDLISIVESFTSTRLLQLVAGLEDKAVFNWVLRRKTWLARGGVDLSDAGTLWVKLLGFVEVRNALQHGQGHLTVSQLADNRRTETLRGVRASGVFLDGDRLVVRHADAVACNRACMEFVRWLDAAAQGPP